MLGDIYGLKMISSLACVEQDGTRPEQRKRTWKERLFSIPWRPWITHKTIQVPNYKPIMFRIGNVFYYHPSFESQIKEMINKS